MPIALVSVSDKTDIEQFCRGLVDRGWDVVSTGGTQNRLAEAGIEFEKDRQLSGALIRITRMRGRLSDTLADAALEANYVLFDKREVERQADQRSKDLEAWLRKSESGAVAPSANVMLEVAAAAKRVFDRVGNWISATDPSKREIALAAHDDPSDRCTTSVGPT